MSFSNQDISVVSLSQYIAAEELQFGREFSTHRPAVLACSNNFPDAALGLLHREMLMDFGTGGKEVITVMPVPTETPGGIVGILVQHLKLNAVDNDPIDQSAPQPRLTALFFKDLDWRAHCHWLLPTIVDELSHDVPDYSLAQREEAEGRFLNRRIFRCKVGNSDDAGLDDNPGRN